MMPASEVLAARIRDLKPGECRAVLYLTASRTPGAVEDALDGLNYAAARADAAVHDVRVRRSGTGLTVYCDPCEWRVHAESGHTDAELARLGAEHRGEVPA